MSKMNELHNTNEKYKIICIGDTHNYNITSSLVHQKFFAGGDTIFIHVGDGGEGYLSNNRWEGKQWAFLDESLREKNSFLYICRGNHSNPELFNLNHEYNYHLKNIRFVPDFTYLLINGKKFLFIGGAVSVDRSKNIIYETWWPNEGVLQDEGLLNSLEETDVVIIHTAPSYCHPKEMRPFVYSWMKFDTTLHDDLILERKWVDKIFEKVKPKFVVRGHFHQSRSSLVDSQSWTFEDLLLDINETKDITENIKNIK